MKMNGNHGSCVCIVEFGVGVYLKTNGECEREYKSYADRYIYLMLFARSTAMKGHIRAKQNVLVPQVRF